MNINRSSCQPRVAASPAAFFIFLFQKSSLTSDSRQMSIFISFTFPHFFAKIKMMTIRTRRAVLILCVLLFLISLPSVLFYTLGYRLGTDLLLYKTGGLYVSSPVTGSKIFVNNKQKKETNIFQSGLFLQSLKPGQYSVLVAKDGYWPWQKNLTIKEQFVTEARAFLLPKDPKGKVILRENYSPLEVSKYNEILASLKATTTEYTRFTSNQKEKLWWDPQKNEVWVRWLGEKQFLPYFFCDDLVCQEEKLILHSVFSIRNVDFYPKRRDVILVAVQNGIYALEIDGRGGRMLQPIYKGKDPIFITYKNESLIYILDEDNLIEIKLP